jgi:hypothetical protein
MGLLDDAIREHLELKRRRGADPDEIEREEREALGAARGQPDAVGQEIPANGVLPDDEQWPEPLAEQPLQAAPAPEAEYAPPVEYEYEHPHPDDLEPAAAAEPHLPPPPPHPPHPAEQPPDTSEYDVEQHLEKEGEEILEETPEFLQDTPDHDRLWFEQRPPRDFDFDS